VEAQRARGILVAPPSNRRWAWRARVGTLVPLAVPAIVLATKRAWAVHEAAAARGFDHPGARCGEDLRFGVLDYALLGTATTLVVVLLSCP